MPQTTKEPGPQSTDYDAIVVGGSLAGCTAAIMLGRAGARVALVEKQPDPKAFKRICSHFIQASAVPTLERLGLLDRIESTGAVRSRIHIWTRWGWIEPPESVPGVNLRRELLDPLMRETAAETAGVELLLGHTATGLLRTGDATSGVTVRDQGDEVIALRARLVVGADGRDSRVVEWAGVDEKTLPHGRFAYGAYFDGPLPTNAPDSTIWFLDPQWAAAFPTDSGLTFYAAMPTKERLPEFKRDPRGELISFMANLPEPPPIQAERQVGPMLGKVEMPNRVRKVVGPGLALVGDAALATDPLFGVGCGWAVQSAEWLSDCVAPALCGEEPLERGLSRYRRRHRSELRGHAFFIHDYATGRRMQPPERMLFSAAVRDRKVAEALESMATRRTKPVRTIAKVMPRAIAVNARHALTRRSGESPVAAAHAPRRVGE